MGRTTELILGLIGGIINTLFGLIIFILTLVGGTFLAALPFIGFGGGLITLLGLILLIVCVLGLVGACIVRRNHTAAGVLMIISGGLLLFVAIPTFLAVIGIFMLIGCVLLIIAGIMACVKKPDPYTSQP